MRRPHFQILMALPVLCVAACGDPLAQVPKLSEIEVADDTVIVELAEMPNTDAETAALEEGGVFQRLLGRRRVLGPSDATNPTENAGAPDEAPKSDGSTDVDADERPQKRTGFWLFGRNATPTVPDVVAPETKQPPENTPAENETAGTEPDTAPTSAPAQAAADPKPRRGFLGFSRRAKTDAKMDGPEAETQIALLGGQADIEAENVTPTSGTVSPERPRRGLFSGGRRTPKNTGPDAQNVPLGTALPYGALARVCGVSKKRLGKNVAKFPQRRPAYHLYDSDPGKITPHVFYLTGFPDGCARTFTAALALFGSPVMHEQLRYGLPDRIQPYSATDRAYEQVKSRICRVGRKSPCGRKIGRLEKDTVFLSIYENFQDNARWTNLLLHRGQVMAADQVEG